MRGSDRDWSYDGREILADGVVHGLGLGLAAAGSVALLGWSLEAEGPAGHLAHLVYCLTLLLTLGVSAAYNLWPVGAAKWVLRRVDHAMIFGLIAGTYTPFLVRVGRTETTVLLVVIWTLGALGMTIKALDLHDNEWLSTALYIALGWSGVVLIRTISAAMPTASLVMLIAGGVCYSGGVAFHHWRSLRFQNAIWHAFVLLGAACHFLAVLAALRSG